MTQEVLENNIRNWAEARNLLSLDSIDKQGMYLIAEIGEAVDEHLKGNLPAMMLEPGDVLVVLQVMRLQLGRECPGDPVPPHGMDTETLLRDSARYAVSASGFSTILAFYNSTSSEALKQEEQAKLVAVLGRLQEYTCRAIQAIGYTPDQARQAVWQKIANRTGKTVDGVFIKDAPGPKLGWIPTAERPLVQPTPSGGWITTEDGDDDFLAAVPYQDANYLAQDLWWIKHCVIEESGLCIVGEDYNEPAGWDVDAVDYFLPITPPSPKA